jgi:hypothetical protein
MQEQKVLIVSGSLSCGALQFVNTQLEFDLRQMTRVELDSAGEIM